MFHLLLTCCCFWECENCYRIYEHSYNHAYDLVREIKYYENDPKHDKETLAFMKGQLEAYDSVIYLMDENN